MAAIRRFCALATAIGALAAAAPAVAASTTYCVGDKPCVDGGGKAEPDLATALDDAQKSFGADTVELGPGDFLSPNGWAYHTASAQNAVHIVGSGADKTRLYDNAPGDTTTLTLSGMPVSSVSDLHVEQGSPVSGNSSALGLDLAGQANHVDVHGSWCTGYPVKLEDGAQLTDSHVAFEGGCTPLVVAGAAGTATIGGTVIDAGYATGVGDLGPGTLNITRSHISGALGVGIAKKTANLDDSLVTATDGVVAYGDKNGTGTVHMANDTIVGVGPSTLGVKAAASDFGSKAIVTVENSIVDGVTTSFASTGPGTPSLTVRYSDYTAPTKVLAGSFDESEANHHVSPGFVDAAGGDFHLRADSPLIDAGTDKLAAPLNTSDLGGADRKAGSAFDIGAFEFQPHPPAAVIGGPDTAVVGQPVTFTSAGSGDPDAGDSLSYYWGVGGAAGDGAEVTYTFATPGAATVELTVKDLAGHAATATKTVDVRPAPIVAVPGPAAPVVKAFSITKKRVALGSRRHPAFRFKLSKAARVRISFVRLAKKARKAGTLSRAAHAGANRVAFAGRIGRRSLKPGRYRATIVATDSHGLRSKPRMVVFKVAIR